MNNIHEGLNALGKSADTNSQEYKEAIEQGKGVLECFASPSRIKSMNPNGAEVTVHIETNEFTSLCPMTGQPDFAKIVINYCPDALCVESKSLKLYFLSFRNRRDFHESCVTTICNDLVDLLQPKWLSVRGEFTPRGGIPFWPTAHYTKPRKDAPMMYRGEIVGETSNIVREAFINEINKPV